MNSGKPLNGSHPHDPSASPPGSPVLRAWDYVRSITEDGIGPWDEGSLKENPHGTAYDILCVGGGRTLDAGGLGPPPLIPNDDPVPGSQSLSALRALPRIVRNPAAPLRAAGSPGQG